MRRVFWPVLAISMAACGGDPWPGTYRGEMVIDGRDCSTGELVDGPAVQPQSITIERGSDGSLFINGRCLFTLDELSSSAARFEPTECETTLGDGTPAHAALVNGRADLDGDELALDFAMDISTPALCVTASASFVGFRE